MTTSKTCAILILLVLVIVGIIVTAIYGFNKELKYEKSQCIDIYVEQEFDKEKIKEIANQIFGTKNIVESVKRKEERKSFDKPFDKKKKTFDKKSSNKPEKEVKVEEAKKEEKAEVKEEKVAVKEEKAAVKEDLTEKTVAELRELAKAKEVKGYSTMKKAELLEALK